MEKMNCNVIYDLLPLYLDGLCSKESKQMIEEHLCECGDCKKVLERMKSNLSIEEDIDAEVIKRVKRRIQIEKIVIVCVTLFVLISVLLVGASCLMFSQVPMNDIIREENVRVEEDENGDIWLVRSGNAIFASHVIGEHYTEEGQLILGKGEIEVEDYEGDRVINVVLFESPISKFAQLIQEEGSSIREEKSLLFNAKEKPERCKVTITLKEREVILWERN